MSNIEYSAYSDLFNLDTIAIPIYNYSRACSPDNTIVGSSTEKEISTFCNAKEI